MYFKAELRMVDFEAMRTKSGSADSVHLTYTCHA